MTKRVLLIGTTTGLMADEKIAQEKAIYVTLKSFKQSNYQTVLLTENRELFSGFHNLATQVIFQDINLANITAIIKQYKIDAVFPTYTDNSKLNIFRNLLKQNFFKENEVKLLVLNQQNLNLTISHKALTTYLQDKGFLIIEHRIIDNYSQAMEFVTQHHFPIIIRNSNKDQKSYWTGISSKQELQKFFQNNTNTNGYEIEQSLNNFKEITMTTVRDRFDNSALIYASEDIDPIGIHANDSISITPVFSLANSTLQRLRDAVLKLTRLLKIVGICTFHLAVDEQTNAFYILKISPLFQSKILPIIESTGYPLFEVICQVSIGRRLQEIETLDGSVINAAVELTPNHLTARFPIWQKQSHIKYLQNTLGPHKSSLGAVIVNGNNLETIIMKGFKILDLTDDIFINHPDSDLTDEQIEAILFNTNIKRILAVCEALNRGFDINEIYSFTKYNLVFIQTIKHLLDLARLLEYQKGDLQLLKECKRYGFSDFLVAQLWNITTAQVKEITKQLSLNQVVLSTPSSFSLDKGAVNNYYTSFLDDPTTKLPKYQIVIHNYLNYDIVSNYEMTILAYQLIHRFQSDGYLVAAQGNLLSKMDSSKSSDYYTDSNYNKSYLYSNQNRLNITINTIENQHINYSVPIYNFNYYDDIFNQYPLTTEIIFIQSDDEQLWLSSPIKNTLKKNNNQRLEINAIPGVLNSRLANTDMDFIHKNLSTVKFGTLILDKYNIVKSLMGFTTNIGIISQINPDFIDVLCHALIGVNASKPKKIQQLFGRKEVIYQQKNGLYLSKIHYFDLPIS